MLGVRPFRDWDDLAAIQAVCSVRLIAAPGRVNAHPGDIAWWAGWPPSSLEQLGEMFLLWEVGAAVAGFAGRDAEDGVLTVFVAPAYADTQEAIAFEDEARSWARREGRPDRWAEFEDDSVVPRWVERGYRPTDEGYLNLVRSLHDVLVDGSGDDRVRPVGDEDVQGRASVTHAAFGSDRPFAEYAADYAAFRATPAYPHGWDLVLRDDDGRAAACCIAWIDRVSSAGTFEPVATHPDFHGRGFGKALLTDGLRRFAAAGMTYAIVGVVVGNTPAEALYRSVGFRPDRMLRVYERP
jgi:ribosomal protein S18 acetylase RimI-like enzyme